MRMKKNKRDPNYKIKIIRVGDRSDEIVRAIVKDALETALAKNGAVADNLDEVLHKYISGEMRNEQKKEDGLCTGLNNERLAEG